MDNRGNHLVAPDNGAINVPAVAAGHVVKRYVAQSLDELSMEVHCLNSESVRFYCSIYMKSCSERWYLYMFTECRNDNIGAKYCLSGYFIICSALWTER